MFYLLTAAQMKAIDEKTISYHKVPSMVLMERASLAVVKHLTSFDLSHTLVVCGSGNNGGDGIAIARLLHLAGHFVEIYFVGDKEKLSDGCKAQMDIAHSYGVRFVNNPVFSEYTTIVDAIFGVGLCRDISGRYENIIQDINESNVSVVAVDIPSGISADNGKILGCAIHADMTVTFAYRKVGLMLYPGKAHCGRLIVEDIGIYHDNNEFDPKYICMSSDDFNLVPRRRVNGNKGTFGKILLIAGSKEMPGASILAGQAVMRTGAGMVRIVAPIENRDILAASIPEAILDIYQDKYEAIECINKGFQWADIVVMGPGMGLSEGAKAIVVHVMATCKLPLIVDADGLNIISENMDLLKNIQCPCIITPHVGEMARLMKKSIKEITDDLLVYARRCTENYNVQCVLKDAATCIAIPNGTTFINETGNSGMATAGSGDVLTGIIAGLLALGVKWEYVGALGSYLHGMCGDRAKRRYSEGYILASDIINELSYFQLGEEITNEIL